MRDCQRLRARRRPQRCTRTAYKVRTDTEREAYARSRVVVLAAAVRAACWASPHRSCCQSGPAPNA
eukprot:7388943-Prymnesium_polylepis.1